ncbi:MAG: hypothetical protein A3J83_06410 [Elusimicrobia bacterium RIFOXYA2_FULL_40_6]|nr:MAG: hypothetical protein A3J83_06410 [Elusimicrobia bacterium RIFOXYA2_FULL_40_6]
MIDIHTHIGRLLLNRPWLTAEKLISAMNKSGIEKSVVLPVENPEELDYYVTTEYVLQECSRYRKRLIPFCGIDPRHRYPPKSKLMAFNPFPIIKEYVKCGCKGVGESLAGIPIDDPMNEAVYDACNRLKLPILIHIDSWINRDRHGLPGLEKMASKYKLVKFILHGPGWWKEMSGDSNSDEDYPNGKIIPGGRVGYLLDKYPNIYGDLSASSGYNALTRDAEYTVKFLEKNHTKLLFGTDYLAPRQKVPIVAFIKNIKISSKTFEAITQKNAIRILNL